MIRRISGYFILIRPINCLIASLSVWTGAAVSSDIYFSYKIMAALVSAFMISGFGNIINDYYDISVDRINHPCRPLASGKIKTSEAGIIAIILASSGLALSPFIHKFAFLIALFSVLSLWIYTPVLKGKRFAGNIVIAIIASLAFIYGGLAVNISLNALILAVFAFFAHFGREIVKDIQDKAADSRAGIETGAVIYGEDTASRIAIITFAALVVLTSLPYFFGVFSIVYLVIVIIGVDTVFLYSIVILSRTKEPSKMKVLSALLKAVMPIGLLAVLLGLQ